MVFISCVWQFECGGCITYGWIWYLVSDKFDIDGALLKVVNFNVVVFSDEVSSQELLNLGLLGPTFTRLRGLHGTFKGVRLDRDLCTIDWKDRFSNVLVRHLPVKLDYAPILI